MTGDSNGLIMAFETLFENQMRFADKVISVQAIQILDHNQKAVRIIISNDGPPFNVKNTERLFDRYQKDILGQSGIGLSIVKQIVNLHRGQITARNTVSGVAFTIELPQEHVF
jgi:two-component system sensor histidine kinase CssS